MVNKHQREYLYVIPDVLLVVARGTFWNEAFSITFYMQAYSFLKALCSRQCYTYPSGIGMIGLTLQHGLLVSPCINTFLHIFMLCHCRCVCVYTCRMEVKYVRQRLLHKTFVNIIFFFSVSQLNFRLMQNVHKFRYIQIIT